MAILQALRPKTLTRGIVFAELCLIFAGAVVLVWMLQFIDANSAGSSASSTEVLDPAAQARIQQFVKAIDAEKSYQVKTPVSGSHLQTSSTPKIVSFCFSWCAKIL